jgi:hypothetical protein
VRGEAAALAPVMGDAGTTQVAHGAELLAFAEAAVGDGDLDAARAALLECVGPEGLVDAAAVVAGFDATDRIADATGTQLDDYLEAGTVELRAELGIDELATLGD